MLTGQPRTILIVDDSPEDREVIGIYLNQDKKYNYTFWEEALGENGLNQIKQAMPDCVLLDFKLPDMSGLEFLNDLTKHLGNNNLPVIMLTGNGDEQVVMQAIRSGATDYLSKHTLTPQNLRWAVDNAIEKGELQRSLDEQRRQLKQSEASLRLALVAERQARLDAETSRQRLAFLADASVALSASLDYKEVISNLFRLVVPAFADGCLLIIAGENNQPDLQEAVHADPGKERILKQLLVGYTNPPEIVLKVIECGQSNLVSAVTEDHLENNFPEIEHREMARSLQAGSIINTPLVVRGETFGLLGVISSKPGYFTEADVPLMEELAGRLAISLENATLFEQVQEAVRAQEELNQLKDLFISIATHELRNPLTAAKGMVQLLQRKLNQQNQDSFILEEEPALGLSKAKSIDWLDRAVYQLERMDGLINHLLDSARVQNKKLVLRYDRGVDLLGLVQRVVEQQQRAYPDHHLRIVTTEEALTADFDEARIEQVLINLVSNAIKYSPSQTMVTLGMEKRPSPSGITAGSGPLTSVPLEAVIFVRDQGYGISPEDQTHIFERFYQVRSSENRSAEGLGLGLYICQDIVIQHGGRLWLESAPGKGSTFYFSILL